MKRDKNEDIYCPCWFCEDTGMVPGAWKNPNGIWLSGIISACKCSLAHPSKYLPVNDFENDPRFLVLHIAAKRQKGKPHEYSPHFMTRLEKLLDKAEEAGAFEDIKKLAGVEF